MPLFVVATPIGNLEDITLRALRILKEVSVVACEDTRVTRKLLNAHEIQTPTLAYHAHTRAEVVDRLIERMRKGEDVALVTDAGTPVVSDPGDTLIEAAIANGISVIPVPGPNAMVAALSAAGLPAHQVLFLGFLPRAEGDQREVLAPLREVPYTLVLHESPKRVTETLASLRRTLGDRRACVARELTKRFETIERGVLSELEHKLASQALGEMVIIVAPSEDRETQKDFDRARKEARELLTKGKRAADVAKTIAGAHGLARQEAYQLVLEIQKE